MSTNSVSFDEVKDLVLAFAKEHPGWTAIGAGIGCGIAYAVPKLAPTIEICWKYSVDKIVERLPKTTVQTTFQRTLRQAPVKNSITYPASKNYRASSFFLFSS